MRNAEETVTRTLSTGNLSIAHNMSIREFMFNEAVSDYEQKYEKLTEEQKDVYRKHYYNVLERTIDFYVKNPHEQGITELVNTYGVESIDDLTEEQIRQYWTNKTEEFGFLPLAINNTFSTNTKNEKIASLYPFSNDQEKAATIKKWNEKMDILKQETQLAKGLTYAHIRDQFLFHQMVEVYNRTKIEKKESEKVITTSKAREMSEKFNAILKRNIEADIKTKAQFEQLSQEDKDKIKLSMGMPENYSLTKNDYIKYNHILPNQMNYNILNALNEVFEQELGVTNTFNKEDTEKARGQYNSINNRFLRMIDAETFQFNEYIPLSPYDPLFANKEVFLRSGCELVFIKREDIENGLEDKEIKTYRYNRDKHVRATYDRNLRTYYGETVFSRATQVPFEDFEKFVSKRQYNLETKNDSLNLSALLPYISKDELDDVSLSSIKDATSKMSKEGIARSVAILKHLQEKGINYTIKKGYDEGGLDAKITGTPYTIKIVVPEVKEKLLGSIYNSKTTMSIRLGIDGINNKQEQLDFKHSKEDTLNMIDYVLASSDIGNLSYVNKRIGAVGEYKLGYNTFNEAYYMSKGKYRFTINTRRTKNGEVGRIMVNMDHADSYEKPIDFNIPLGIDRSDTQAVAEAEKNCDEAAETYLREAIKTATVNFNELVSLEKIIEEYESHKDEPDFAPSFSSNETIEAIQKFYWEQLVEEKEYEDTEEEWTDTEKIEWVRSHFNEYTKSYIGTYEPEFDETGISKRFDAEVVANYMTSAIGTVGNRENIVRAMKRLNIPAQELRGNEYQNQMFENRMLKFHPSLNVESMLNSQSPFVKDIGQSIKDTLLTTGCVVDDKDILIDDNGMVKITAKRRYDRGIKNGKINEKVFTAEFGQIFIPDEDGMIKTKYAGTENYATIPGNEIRVVGTNEDGTLQERIRIHTYKDMIKEQAARLVREALFSGEQNYENSVGFSSVYSKLKSEHLSLDYKQEMIEAGMDKGRLKAIMDTARLQCTWQNANDIRENATLLADFQHSKIFPAADGTLSAQQLNEIVNDNFRDTYKIMGRNNINQLGHWCDGIFDINMTSGAKNQGINIYLNPDAIINDDGSVTPAEDIYKSVPLMEYIRYYEYDAWDRIQMTTSNSMSALCAAPKTKTVQMEFGGKTFDDGPAVSKKFAEKLMVKDENGNKRSLQIGDKISDTHGNKGVISFVIDPEMDTRPISENYVKKHLKIDFDSFKYEKTFNKMRGKCTLDGKTYTVTTDAFRKKELKTLKKQILEQQIISSVIKKENEYRKNSKTEVDWLKANPEIEVIAAPHSQVGRLNAGAEEELRENTKEIVDPYNPNRKISCAMGETDYIVTPMTTDKKTRTYGEEELAEGKGRKASSQLAWALCSQGADKVMRELYGNNNAAFVNLREYMISFGMDIDNVGTFKNKYIPQPGEERNIAKIDEKAISNMYELRKTKGEPDKTKGYMLTSPNKKKLKEQFAKQLDSAGFMEIPFAITMANGEETPQLPNGNYRLPILAKNLRSEQSFQDGRFSEHEYTKNYTQIFSHLMDYKVAQENLALFKEQEDKDQVKKTEELLKRYQNKAQASYDRVVDSIIERKFSTKDNYIKEHIMGAKVKDSATAVWTANPTLDIDQIAVSPDIAESMNLVDDGYILVWRDPILRDAGLRYMRVKIDDNLRKCVSINPAMDKCFDGDFDGDTIGLVKLNDKEAIQQAMDKLTVNANLLDHGTGGNGKNKELSMHEELDIKSVEHNHPNIKERFKEATEEVNRIEKEYKDNPQKLKQERNRMVREISDLYQDSFMLAFIDENHNPNGCYNVWDQEKKEHLHRLEHMISTGAKGKIEKLKEYSEYMGVYFEYDANKKIIEESIRVYDKPFGMYDDTTPDASGEPFNARFKDENGKIMTAEEATRTKKMNTQIATAVKSTGTGIAGAYSQRGMAALRNLCPRAVLEMTYPVTQGILQAKHDEKDARIKFEAIMGVTRKIWNAEKIEKYENKKTGETYWRAVTDEENDPVRTTYGEFIAQFEDVYSSEYGLNVKANFDHIRTIANYLVDPEDVEEQKKKYGDNFDITKCKMRGIEYESFLEEYESPMDKLAYSYGNGRETVTILSKLAKEGKNLFEGEGNKMFMPNTVRNNVKIMEQQRAGNTEELNKTKDAIKDELAKAADNGETLTKTEVANRIINNGTSSHSRDYIRQQVGAVQKEQEMQKNIVSKVTQEMNTEKNQERNIRKRQENLNLKGVNEQKVQEGMERARMQQQEETSKQITVDTTEKQKYQTILSACDDTQNAFEDVIPNEYGTTFELDDSMQQLMNE